MKTLRSILCLLLVAALLCTTLLGCKEDPDTPPEEPPVTEQPPEDTGPYVLTENYLPEAVFRYLKSSLQSKSGFSAFSDEASSDGSKTEAFKAVSLDIATITNCRVKSISIPVIKTLTTDEDKNFTFTIFTIKSDLAGLRSDPVSTHKIKISSADSKLAENDDLIRKNPFSFQLVEVIVNDSVRREALSRENERKFLNFVKDDPHFNKYYEGIYILFKTGMRISEFCGLTISDIDFEEHSINIDHQLMKHGSTGYYIQKTKTESGTRVIPMTPDVEECFRKIIENRNPPRKEPIIDGKTGFLYFDKDGSVMYSLHWEHYFKHIREKYNSIYKVEMPLVTPHICRHTYCSNMARSGMNPKTLQYLMGHSEIGVTLNTYTHTSYEDAKAEISKLGIG